jgi:hypothetical protein
MGVDRRTAITGDWLKTDDNGSACHSATSGVYSTYPIAHPASDGYTAVFTICETPLETFEFSYGHVSEIDCAIGQTVTLYEPRTTLLQRYSSARHGHIAAEITRIRRSRSRDFEAGLAILGLKSRGEIPEFASQRLGRASLTRGKTNSAAADSRNL